MKSTLFLFIVLCVNPLFANSIQGCWASENDPRNHQPYSSEQGWRNDVRTWENKNIQIVSPVKLAVAYHIYKSELPQTMTLANDKVVHCYMGCKIARKTDYQTVNFLAWYKEYTDLTDCQQNSNFEFLDYDATVYGAETAARDLDCVKTCGDVFRH